MRTLKISLLVFFLSITISAQVGWFWQNPLPQGNTLESVCSTDSNEIFAVGFCGTILKSIDGGEEWISQRSGITKNLNGVSFINRYIGIAVGFDGTIIKTTNGGEYWFEVTSGTIEDLNSVQFITETILTVVGNSGTILRSNDAGISWMLQSSGITNDLNDVYFIDPNIGNAVGWGGKILRTTDGGINWTQYTFGGNPLFLSVYFLDSNYGIVVGITNRIYRTTNGGLNWTWQGPASGIYNFEDVLLINDSLGIIAGWDEANQVGKVLVTTDGGITWHFANTGEIKPFYFSVSLTGGDEVCIVGWEGIIIKSTDFGENWIEKSSGTRMPLDAISFSDELHGTAVGTYGANNTILRTNDGGLHWYPQDSNVNAGLLSVTFTDRYNGTAVGDYFDAIILRTSNGGISWNTQYFSETEELYGVSFIDSCIGTAVGYPGKILRTTDAGLNWQVQSSGTTARLKSVTLIDAENGFVVGDGGVILKTTNGGLTWTTVWVAQKDLNCVSFQSGDVGIAVGDDGLIVKTTNNGETWTSQQSGVIYDLYSVAFSNSENVTVVGGDVDVNGYVLRTTNGGDNWSIQVFTTYSLLGVCIINDSVGYICGSGGTILKTLNGGIVTEGGEIKNVNLATVENFSLSQNYPNPFNPVTKIKFEIPDQVRHDNALVTLKVYDILGREIATLVNEEKPAGEYEVEFNAANLPSGIYFYQLRAGQFTETKKMILLK